MKILWVAGIVIILFFLGCSNPTIPAENINQENEEERPSVFITRWNTYYSRFYDTPMNIVRIAGSRYWSESGPYQIRLPLHPTGRYDFTVKWGDGSQSEITRYSQPEAVHTYARPGEYTVEISGTIEGFGFYKTPHYYYRGLYTSSGDSAKLLDVESWGPVKLHSQGGQFYFAENPLRFSAPDTLDVSNMTSMNSMFANAARFEGNISNWDVSNVTNMGDMFTHARRFNGNISNWDVSNVTNMHDMFNYAIAFNQDISNWDVDQVTNYTNIFYGAFMMNPSNKPARFR